MNKQYRNNAKQQPITTQKQSLLAATN